MGEAGRQLLNTGSVNYRVTGDVTVATRVIPPGKSTCPVVNDVLGELEMADKPVLHVFNKVDRLDTDQLHALQELARERLVKRSSCQRSRRAGWSPCGAHC